MSGGGGKTQTVNNIPAELAPLARSYAGKAMQIGDTPYTPFMGQRFVTQPNAQQTQATNYFAGQLSGGTNPYLDQMVQKAQKNLLGNWQNTIMPGIDAMEARSGSFGNTGIQDYRLRSQDQLQTQLGDVATQMYGSQYNADQTNRSQAAQALTGIGNYNQQVAQQPLDFAYQQFQEQQNQPYKNLSAMGAPFGQNMGGSQTTSQNPGTMGTLQSLMGLGLLGGALFSDKRLKTDIKKVGETEDGTNIYTYKYRGDDTTQMGVMAQEVKKKNPEAVKSIGGLLAVDYSKVS